MKNGKSISAIVPDEDYDFEVSKHFGSKFLPTPFVHGGNPFIPCKLSIQAHKHLEEAGNESELLFRDDVVHISDLELDEEDPKFIKCLRS